MSIGGNDGLFDVTKDIGLKELIEAQNNAEVQAERQAALIGDSDKKCTFDQGYINQSVYSCRTCRHSGGDDKDVDGDGEWRAGICRGCAFNCHLSHEVDELFMKRKFRCDCGTKKFKDRAQSTCTLCPSALTSSGSSSSSTSSTSSSSSEQKTRENVTNEENRYSQNFDGDYCYCSKPYVSASDTMYQCTGCEDWFHDRCLINKLPADKEVELFCKKCAPMYAFLVPYSLNYGKTTAEEQNKSEPSDENDSKFTNGCSTGPKSESTPDEAVVAKQEPVGNPGAGTPSHAHASESDDTRGQPPAKRQRTESSQDVSRSTATKSNTSSTDDSHEIELPHKSAKSTSSSPSDAKDTDTGMLDAPPRNDQPATESTPSVVATSPSSSTQPQQTVENGTTPSSEEANSSATADCNNTSTTNPQTEPDDNSANVKMRDENQNGAADKCAFLKLDAPAPAELLQRELYFEMGWRDRLCRCDECVRRFDDYGLSFMLEDEGEDEGDPEAVNYINTQMEDEALEREQENDATMSSSSRDGSVAPMPGGTSSSCSGGASNAAFSVEDLAFKALEKLPRAQVVQTISHFQVYSQAIRDGLREWAEAHPGETVSREAMQGVTQEAKRVASEARRNA